MVAAEPTAAEIDAAAPHLMHGSDGSVAGEKFARAIARGDARRALTAVLPLVEARLTTCDCDASRDGIDFHQGYCRSLSTDEKRARWVAQAARTSQVIHERNEHAAEVERLRAAVRQAFDAVDWNSDGYNPGVGRAILRDALTPDAG